MRVLRDVRPLEDLAYELLHGYGDAQAGEWRQFTGKAFHLRRRLSAAEQSQIGTALDCRGTDEGLRRLVAIRRLLPAPAVILAMEELGL